MEPGLARNVQMLEILNSLKTGIEEIARGTADTHICDLLQFLVISYRWSGEVPVTTRLGICTDTHT